MKRKKQSELEDSSAALEIKEKPAAFKRARLAGWDVKYETDGKL